MPYFWLSSTKSNDVHRIVDTRNGKPFALRANVTMPLSDAFCSYMVNNEAPQLENNVAKSPVYSRLSVAQIHSIKSYLGVPVEISGGTRLAALAAYSARKPF